MTSPDNALNAKLYKYESDKMYVKVPNPSEDNWINISDILTKKDVIDLIDIVGNMMQLICSCRKDHEVVHMGLEYLSEKLVNLRKELVK